jgi:opacity protein-like surface antigen
VSFGTALEKEISMKKVLFALAAAGSLLAPQVHAQAQNFGGFSLGANVDMNATHTETTISGTFINGVGQQTWGGSVQAAYAFVASEPLLVSLGATYSLADIDALKLSSPSGTALLKLKNAHSVYVEPGFAVSDKTLAYAKLSYEAGTLHGESSSAAAVSKDVHGAGFGIGLRTMVSKNLYLQAEARRVNYDSARFEGDTSDFKTSLTVGTVGLGYRF